MCFRNLQLTEKDHGNIRLSKGLLDFLGLFPTASCGSHDFNNILLGNKKHLSLYWISDISSGMQVQSHQLGWGETVEIMVMRFLPRRIAGARNPL